MEPREFFIEDRLENYRNHCKYNLGESGFNAFSLGEILNLAGIPHEELLQIPMYDSPHSGGEDLRQEIASLYPGVNSKEVLVCTGTGEALYLAFQLLVSQSTRVALYWPAFQALYEIPKMLGAEIIKVPADKRMSAKNWENIEADLFVINHPHNPTGQDLDLREKDELLKILKRKGKPVLFDEHYRFLGNEAGLSWTGVATKDKFFGTGSFTKCFGVTGLRIGWLIADEEFIRRARSYKDYLTHTVSPISEAIAFGLLKNRKNFQSQIASQVEKNIHYFIQNLDRLPDILEFLKPSGGLVGWAKLRENISSETYADDLYQKTGIFVLPGKNFEEEGYLRIGFGENPLQFKAAVDVWTRQSAYLC